MLLILQLFKLFAVLVAAALLVGLGRYAARQNESRDPAEPTAMEPARPARRLALLLWMAVAAALVARLASAFYMFTDADGSLWSVYGHGWPILIQEAMWLPRQGAALAIYVSALAVDLLCAVAVMAAAVKVLDRWLPRPGKAPSHAPGRQHPWWLEAAGLGLAVLIVLVLEYAIAQPISFPGTQTITIYFSFAQEAWYVRLFGLLGLAAAIFMLILLAAQGILAFIRLREEGVI